VASTVNLKAKGLSKSPNQLDVQEGSLIIAKNCIIRRDGVIESRRGYKIYGNSFGSNSDRAKQLAVYKQKIIRHYGSTLQVDNGSGTFSSFSGSYSETQTGLRIKSIEANGNFYFTTSEGIKKISAASSSDLTSSTSITNAGGVKALDLTGEVSTTLGDQSSFFTADSVVAYRLVWGTKDASGNLILGTPSAKVDVTNSLLETTLQDFNKTLDVLDKVGQASASCLISDKNYVGTLVLPISATATELYTNLQTLVTKIDTDIYLANDSGGGTPPMDISGVSISGTTATVTMLSGAPNSYLATGSKVYLTGFTSAGTIGDLNGLHTVLTAGATTFTFTTTATGAITHTAGQIYSGTFRSITAPSAPSVTPTHDQLASLQDQLESIIAGLNDLTAFTAIIPTASAAYITASDFDVTTASQVTLTVTIPNDITSSYFYQLYRTAVNPATGTDILANKAPGDEMALVIEDFPTAAELSAKSLTIIDNTPDEFRGANLYTNEISGEGILAANDLPPFAKDINRYKNVTFYANTRTRHRKSLSLLGVTNMLSDYSGGNTPYLTITNGTTTNTYSFVTGRQEVTTVQTVADVADSLNGKYFTLNTPSKSFYVWYKTSGGANSDPAPAGKTGIKVLVDTGETANNVAAKTNTTLASYIDDFSTGISTNTVTVTNLEYGYATDAAANTSGFTVTVTTQGRGENATNKEVLLSDAVSAAQAVDETARSLVRVINKQSSEIINAFYLSGSNDVPGKILFEARTLNATPYYILGNNANTGDSFNPSFAPSSVAITNISVANPTVVTATGHGLTTGNQIVLSGSNSTPSIDGVYTVTVTGANTFTVPVNVTVLGSKGGWELTSDAEISENEEKPNRIYYSKLNQPESVPLLNYFDVSAQDAQILRIFPLRDSLFVFKVDGLYRVSGEIAPFTQALFDGTCTLLAPDSLSTTNNLLYGWATEGIQSISEAGVSTISRDIDVDLLKLASSQYTNFTTATWGLGYDSDNSYTVYTIQETDDTSASIGYRYSTLTDSWTTVDKEYTCGVNNPVDDKLYLGAGDTNFIEQERKTFSRYDYADREFSSTIAANSITGSVIKLAAVSDYSVGDVVVQEQKITTYIYNNLLLKLDMDPLLSDVDYSSTLISSMGDNISTKLDSLITKIANDTGRLAQPGATLAATYTALSPVGSSFTQQQTAYNALMTLLNADTGVGFSNYVSQTLTHNFESIITAIDTITKKITVNLELDYIVGPITIYKAISVDVTYAPNHMGDPLGLKHIREATIMFENRAFTNATLSFATDLLPSFDPTPFNMSGNGIFGHGENYGDGFFGGLSNSAPFRTTLPRDKQRCRYILVKFEHKIAREQWAIFGVTLTGRVGLSSRAYR